MPSLQTLLSDGNIQTTLVPEYPQIEPLGGPIPTIDLMDRFPEAVYQQGPDTHLFKFLDAMCGDAGAGLIKKQAFLSRLADEAEILQYKDLDTFYVHHFEFRRLRNEIYDLDTDTQAMTPADWDNVNNCDESYRHRVQSFFNATRLGCTPDGMAMAAEAGSGIECEVREHYKYIFDQYSDDPLGLEPVGHTESLQEFVVMPRLVGGDGVLLDGVAYESSYQVEQTLVVPDVTTLTPGLMVRARPVSIPNSRSVTSQLTQTSVYNLNPDIHRNVLDILDRLRPVTATPTVLGQEFRRIPLVITNADSSSERIIISRFVSGRPDVDWPNPDREQSMFIEGGVENEVTYYANQQQEIVVIFHTIEGVNAYKDAALLDDSYNTSAFYSTDDGRIVPIDKYASQHVGPFSSEVSQVFPFLQVLSDAQGSYTADNGLAQQNTLLFVQGDWK